MFQSAPCSETVSIVRALLLGADGACIDIGPTSLIGGIALFVGAVVLLRFLGALALRRMLPRRRRPEPSHSPTVPPETGVTPMPYESPIRSTGAWGGKAR